MATTSLFVEIIVIGSLAELWFVAFLVALQPPETVSPLLTRTLQSDATGAAIVGMLLAVTYAVGWVVNFVCERAFKALFEKRLRDTLFEESPTAYHEARALVFQKGSSDLLHELVLDRHIIRIVRSNVFNFFLIGVGVVLNRHHLSQSTVFALVVACWFIAGASFYQWKARYTSYYKQLAAAAAIIKR